MDSRSRTSEQSGAETARFFSALREHPVLVGLVTLFAVGVALATMASSPERYEAETELLVSPLGGGDEALAGLGLLSDPAGAVFAGARLAETPQVTGSVLERLNLRISRKELLGKITVTPLPQSNSFSIKAKEESPKKAARLANTFAEAILRNRADTFAKRLRATIDRLERQRSGLSGADAATVARDLDDRIGYLQGFAKGGDPTLAILTPAVAPDVPAVKSKLSIVVAFVAALLLGSGLAIALELLNPRLRGDHDLPEDVPLLTRIPFLSERAARRFFSGQGPVIQQAIEPYRILRARLGVHGGHAGLPPSVLVTGSGAGDGKTRTAVGLAAAIAASGQRVVLVDADLRGSRTAGLFGLEPRDEGFISLLDGEPIDLHRALVPAGDRWPGLRVLFAGRDAWRGVDLLEPARVEAALAELAGEADVIVLDSPSITDYADAITLARAAGLVIVAVRIGHSRQDRLEEGLKILDRVGTPAFGLVVTQRRHSRRRPPQRRRQGTRTAPRPSREAETPVGMAVAVPSEPSRGRAASASTSPAGPTPWA